MILKTTDLCDEFSKELQMIGSSFRSYGGKKSFYGPIQTVKVFEDNVLVKKALETIPAGSVLVVDGGGSNRCALLGDRLGEIGVERGIAGVIINGCIRDCAELGSLDIGVLALGTHPKKSNKEGKGEVNVTLNFFDVEWNPNDYVYVDEDGIVVAPRKLHK